MIKLKMMFLLMLLCASPAFAQQGKEDRIKKNEFFDLEIYLAPLWTDVIEIDDKFPKTTVITVWLIPVAGHYFDVCRQGPYIIDALIMELNRNPPTQKQLQTIERSYYSAVLTKAAKKSIKNPEHLFSVEYALGFVKDVSTFQRRETRSCSSGRISG